jgi:uncharacterized protein (DUF2249 family)
MDRFKKLTSQERKEYVANILIRDDENTLRYKLSYDVGLSSAFTWDTTIQGHDYWRTINRRIESLYV